MYLVKKINNVIQSNPIQSLSNLAFAVKLLQIVVSDMSPKKVLARIDGINKNN